MPLMQAQIEAAMSSTNSNAEATFFLEEIKNLDL